MRYQISELSVGGILDQAINLAKNHFVQLFLITLVLLIPVNLINELVAQPPQIVVTSPANNGGLGNSPATRAQIRQVNANPMAGLIAVVLLLIVYPLTNAAIIHAIACAYLEIPTSLGTAYSRAASVFIPLVVTGILSYLAILAGLILFIIPGIILAFRLALTTHVVVIERAYFVAALKRSWRLMKGNVGTAFVLGLLVAIINFSVSLGVGLIPQPQIAAVLRALLGGILFIFASAVWVVFYFSCRCKAENFDLTMLANAVEAPDVAGERFPAAE